MLFAHWSIAKVHFVEFGFYLQDTIVYHIFQEIRSSQARTYQIFKFCIQEHLNFLQTLNES